MNYQFLFQCLKGVGRFNLSSLSLPVMGTTHVLCPVNCNFNNFNEEIIEMLTTARNTNYQAFLTSFPATKERTRKWLSNLVAKDDGRILFVLKDACSGNLYGYMGFAYGDTAGNRIEGDAIVKYSKENKPGLMQAAFMELIEWARQSLEIKEIWVRVLSDNPAIVFYQRCRFIYKYIRPLYEVKGNDGKIEALT